MIHGRQLDKKLLIPGLAILGVLVIGAEVPAFGQGRATATRSSGSNSGNSSRVSSTSSNTTSSRATSTSRSATPRSNASPKAVDTRQSTPASRGRHYGGGSGHYYNRPYSSLGLHFGWGGYYGWGNYYYPYYYSPFYWGVPYYVPRRAHREYRLGAFDLNVRPKKAEVYLDGQYIGNAGRYDGFPEHLWLEKGTYELIFYRPGLGTERRVLTVYPGVVVDVRVQLQPGESIPPSELTDVERTMGAMAEVQRAYESQATAAANAPPPRGAELDARAEPGRVRLSILPTDASVYLDGRLLGSGDELKQLHAGLVVDPGNHMIEVVRPGYDSQQLEFDVEPGKEVEVKVLLKSG